MNLYIKFMNNKGGIENFELFDEFLEHIINGTNLLPNMTKNPFLFSEPSIHDKENRMQLTQLMFEKYQIPSLFICKTATLASFSIGKTTCLIFDSGHSFTSAVPVHDGLVINKAILTSEIAGKETNKTIF